MALSSADFSRSPPALRIPSTYNAATDLIERNLLAGRAGKTAYIDDAGAYTYGELAGRVDRFAAALTGLGIGIEQRVLLCVPDSIDFPTAFLGAIKAGIIPIPANTLLKGTDYAYMLYDSRASALIVSEDILPEILPLLAQAPFLRHVIVSGTSVPRPGCLLLRDLLEQAPAQYDAAPTRADEACFWLYSSGSTGAPKGTVHAHSSLIETAVYYGQAVLGIRESDVGFSAAKLFFAYGLGNALTFPLSVGATTILMAQRAQPGAVIERIHRHRPSIFFGVPTLFSSLLADGSLPGAGAWPLRRCTSAGEMLPEEVSRRWHQHTGTDILDGIGSTEMLHIFLSNRPGDVRYGTLGRPVPGYEVKICDDAGEPTPAGEVGELFVRGPSAALHYWNQRERTRATFQGHWTRTGDKFRLGEHGRYEFAGRSDDMLKVGGIYVSPIEVEAALLAHPAVREAAVVGKENHEKLVKPLAFVVLAQGTLRTPELAEELKNFVKNRLAPYKYPRWIEFVPELPKTATGKIQRFRLRQRAAEAAL